MDDSQSIVATSSTISTIISLETIHIVYVHGFQGDHTTFQAFPSDLHNHLLPYIPNLQSWIYPTYKSAKPLTFAVKNFLIWLASLQDGHIILAGHSMGGLLVAEAATARAAVCSRIIGILAFDTPYLGMHPHVVISGIASLFQKKEDVAQTTKDDGTGEKSKSVLQLDKGIPAPSAQGMPSEKSMNDEEKVNFVSSIDAYPEGTASPSSLNTNMAHSPIKLAHSPTSMFHSPTSMFHPYQPPSPSKLSASSNSTHSVTSSLITSTLSFIQKHPNERFMRFMHKHSDAPFQAMTRWVVEYFEFGFAMFDYSELMVRYRKLEKWDGDWVNFWTETIPKKSDCLEVRKTRSIESDDGSVTDDEKWSRPPTPKKVVRRRGVITTSKEYETQFEAAMKKAMKKETEAKEKEAVKRFEMAQKEEMRIAREEEKARRKEEARQEKERLHALEVQEKERKKREKERARAEKEKKKACTDQDQSNPDPPRISIEESQDHELKSPNTDAGLTGDSVSISDENKSSHRQDETVSSRPASPALSNRSSRPPSPDDSSPHHFITLPSNARQTGFCKKHWLKVPIAGVDDEVAAHCGLFFRHQNHDYDQFVERVGKVVRSWVE